MHIGQLFDEQMLKSFQQLIQEFNLPSQDHKTFLKIRHLQKNKESENRSREPSNIEQIIIRREEEKLKKGIISRFYRALQHDLKNKDLIRKGENWN